MLEIFSHSDWTAWSSVNEVFSCSFCTFASGSLYVSWMILHLYLELIICRSSSEVCLLQCPVSIRTNGSHLLQTRLFPLNDSKLFAVMLKGKQYFVLEEIFLVNIRYFLSHLVNFFFHKFVSSPSPGNLIGKLLCLFVCLSLKTGPSFCVQITQMKIQVILLRQRNKHKILLLVQRKMLGQHRWSIS